MLVYYRVVDSFFCWQRPLCIVPLLLNTLMKVFSIISFSISSAIVMLSAYLQSHLLIGLDKSLDCWCCCLVEKSIQTKNSRLWGKGGNKKNSTKPGGMKERRNEWNRIDWHIDCCDLFLGVSKATTPTLSSWETRGNEHSRRKFLDFFASSYII